MTDSYQKLIAESTAAIIAQLPKDTKEEMREFTRRFFQKMPVMEIEALQPEEGAKIVQRAYQAMQQRKPGELHLSFAQEGAESSALILVNDDMPFLVDSVTAELNRHNLSPVKLIHPILHVKRDKKGRYEQVLPKAAEQAIVESCIYIELPVIHKGMTPDKIKEHLREVLSAVRRVVDDWKFMMTRVDDTLTEIASRDLNGKQQDEVEELSAFLNWMRDGNFIFLGAVDYDFSTDAERFKVVEGTELGLFSLEDFPMKPQGYSAMPAESRHFALMPNMLEITKSNTISVVHRPVHMDYIGIKRFDARGKVMGERRFLGLFTSGVYYQSTETIPILRRKMSRLLQQSNFDPNSHDGKALKTIIEFAPRDELFQMSEQDVFDYAIGVLSVEANPEVHLFMRRDLFERFVSCMVFIPRDRFNTGLRKKVSQIVTDSLNGELTDYYTQVTDSPLARLHLIVKTTPGKIPDVSVEELEAQLAEVTYRWSDMLKAELKDRFGEKEAQAIFHTYNNAFSQSYINQYPPSSALYDIVKIRDVIERGNLTLALYRRNGDSSNTLHLKFYNPEQQAALSDILPMLENLGFRVIDEHPFRITPQGAGAKAVWIRDFTLELRDHERNVDLDDLRTLLEEVLLRVWEGKADNDGFNALALLCGLNWRQITLLRAYSRYARQTSLTYSNKAMVEALTEHPEIAATLVEYFECRFDPEKGENCDKTQDTSRSEERDLHEEIEWLLGSVSNLEEDAILRVFRDLISSTWRTNYYQMNANGQPKDYISFKFNSANVPGLPLPRPFAEIFVYSRRVEGIHLRGGKVARGGLRWSDRREDYRTEILGLMKAQMVKNAVIVPVGSKGGFVVKHPPKEGGRDAMMQEGIECYQTYLRGLLDITDNLVEGKIVPPEHVVRYDEDDPYLVVAADKGTATFSDYANEISAEYNFWLGDAFASGGSVGYDHKKMGITARGAWVSVQRHFREMGIDCQKEDFSCIGIGDMSGDVFGNGMLLSEHTKLVGAFNHLHIFLDPNPDVKRSYAERKRLFEMPRSSWTEYQPSLISEGGGVFSRSDKKIDLTPQIRELLALDEEVESLSPNELISAMLKAPVDLLWNGGIGTYVKAESETHEQVGDRANNLLRVNGNELRCKIVGEGGNLGFTQLGRIEYARQGGRVNTDAIDNSAGVDCSDHEVNIKIAFRALLETGDYAMETRNGVLEEMTDEVARLVLRDNMLQTQAISTAQSQGAVQLEAQERMMNRLEAQGLLNRKVEFLPNTKQMQDRKIAGEPLTRPELSVLLSYAKMAIYDELLSSNLPDEEHLQDDLIRYFPKQMRENYEQQITHHRLKREIIATSLTNSIVNRAGITFFAQIHEDTGLPPCDIARAYIIARDAFEVRDMWRSIEACEEMMPAETSAEMFVQTSQFLERIVIWLLRNLPQPLDIAATMEQFVDGIDHYLKVCDSLVSNTLKKAYAEKKERFMEMQVPEEMAHRVARMEIASCALDVIKISDEQSLSIEQAGELYFQIGARLRLGWLRREASRMDVSNYWERLASKAIISELFDQQRRLAMTAAPKLCDVDGKCDNAIEKWQEMHAKTLQRFHGFIDDLKSAEAVTFPMLIIALRNVEAVG